MVDASTIQPSGNTLISKAVHYSPNRTSVLMLYQEGQMVEIQKQERNLYLGVSLVRDVCVGKLIKNMGTMCVCPGPGPVKTFDLAYGVVVIVSGDNTGETVPN